MNPDILPDACVNCGHPIDYVRAFAGGPPHWVHRLNGLLYCNNLAGTFACPPSGGVG